MEIFYSVVLLALRLKNNSEHDWVVCNRLLPFVISPQETALQSG